MPPRYYDKPKPFPDFLHNWDGAAPIDQITAQWVYKHQRPPEVRPGQKPPPPRKLPEVILEIFQAYNAGPAWDPDHPNPPPDFPPNPHPEVDPHQNGHNGHNGAAALSDPEPPEPDTALDRAAAALVEAGWEPVSDYYSKDFRHLYFRPPPDQAWKPSRRLFNSVDPYGDKTDSAPET